jgi:EAL domain-containing protein (putative c-di-GMP-specific phosphodiesterase class I)
MAIGISVDDFGTGYSSLRYLRQFPISEVKIDRVFTSHVGEPDDDAIVQAIIDLATRLRQSVIAEGVESAEVWDRLLALGCPAVQGFYLAPAMPAVELDAWLAERPVASAR